MKWKAIASICKKNDLLVSSAIANIIDAVINDLYPDVGPLPFTVDKIEDVAEAVYDEKSCRACVTHSYCDKCFFGKKCGTCGDFFSIFGTFNRVFAQELGKDYQREDLSFTDTCFDFVWNNIDNFFGDYSNESFYKRLIICSCGNKRFITRGKDEIICSSCNKILYNGVKHEKSDNNGK